MVFSLFIINCINQRSDISNLDPYIVTITQTDFRIPHTSNSWRSSRHDNCSLRECRSLREERNNFWDGEYHLTIYSPSANVLHGSVL